MTVMARSRPASIDVSRDLRNLYSNSRCLRSLILPQQETMIDAHIPMTRAKKTIRMMIMWSDVRINTPLPPDDDEERV